VNIGHFTRPSAAIRMLFILYGVAIAAFFPFFALFLWKRGLDYYQIGFVIAVMSLARIAANPVWGHLADARLGRRTVVQLETIAAALAALALFGAGRRFAWLLVASALFAALAGAVGPNVDAMALVHLGEGRMHRYGSIRAWESLSYAVATLALGFVLYATDVQWMLIAYAAVSVLLLAWTFTLLRDQPDDLGGHGRFGAAGAALRSSSRFRMFLASSLFVWVGFAAAWNFIPLRIQGQGGDARLVGLGLALGGASEVGMMLLSPHAAKRFGLRTVYVGGACIYATGFLVWGLMSSPLLISLSSVFEGLGFGLLFTSGVVIVGKLLPRSLYSSGQSIAGMVAFGVGSIIGGELGGLLYKAFGPVTTYVASSATAFVGAVLAHLALDTPQLSSPATEEPETDLQAEPEIQPGIGLQAEPGIAP
jgi:PPP family 3-phenylpropionic acid transporter